MPLGWRVDTLRKVCRSLGDMEWADAALIVREAGASRYVDLSSSESLYQECIWCLQDVDADVLQELDDYLHSATQTSPTDEPWHEPDKLRLFLSHLASRKTVATELARVLSSWGVEAFVAHEAIDPNQEWQRVIEAALGSCDGLVALLHDEFTQSRWCDQEIGYVFGRHQPVLSLSYDIDPYGFLGNRQALRASASTWENVKMIVRTLLDDPRSGARMSDALVTAICRSGFWDLTNDALPLLRDHGSHLTDAHATRLREAEKHNINVYEAHAVKYRGALQAIEAKFEIKPTSVVNEAPPGYDPAEEPF